MEIIVFSIDFSQNFSTGIGRYFSLGHLGHFFTDFVFKGFGIGSTQTDTSVVEVLSKFRFQSFPCVDLAI
jgi:hypothetical protein